MISYGGPELLLLFVVFIITPIVYRQYLKTLDRKKRILCISSLWAITFLIGYTDVIYISLKARKLCREEAGLHVYKTFKTDRVYADITQAEKWLNIGFNYVEGFNRNQKVRLYFKDGKIFMEDIDYFTVKYEGKTYYQTLNIPITKQREALFVFNSAVRPLEEIISANELLGEIISFTVYPGWLDRRLLGLLGFTWIPPRCDGDYKPEPGKRIIDANALLEKAIIPSSTTKGDKP